MTHFQAALDVQRVDVAGEVAVVARLRSSDDGNECAVIDVEERMCNDSCGSMDMH